MSTTTTDPILLVKEQGKHFQKLAKQKILGPENLHQLWCPSLRALNLMGRPAPKGDILKGWLSPMVRDIGRNRYMGAMRSKNMRVYPLLRYYNISIGGKGTGEQNSLAFILDQPGKSGCIPQEGVNLEGKMSPHFEDGECRTTTGNMTIRATPLGKKGVVMLHTMNQVCPLKMIKGGQFLRFLPAQNVSMSIRRAAITLRKLASADPKTLNSGHLALENEIMRQLVRTAQVAADQIHSLRSIPDELERFTRAFAMSLPTLESNGVQIRIIADKAFGPDPRTWVTSIHTTNKDNTEEQNYNAFSEFWKDLVS